MVDLVLALYPAIFFWNVRLRPMHKLGLSVLYVVEGWNVTWDILC